MRRLYRDGWDWAEYLPPSKRPKKLRHVLDAHTPESARVIKTSVSTVSKLYLLCLLDSEQLFSEGLACIPHGQVDRVYADIQKRNFSTVLAIMDKASEDPLVGAGAATAVAPLADAALAHSEVDHVSDHPSDDEEAALGMCISEGEI